MAEGDRVELRDFGTFCIRDSDPRVSWSPSTGERMAVPARAHVYFKPGKEVGRVSTFVGRTLSGGQS